MWHKRYIDTNLCNSHNYKTVKYCLRNTKYLNIVQCLILDQCSDGPLTAASTAAMMTMVTSKITTITGQVVSDI